MRPGWLQLSKEQQRKVEISFYNVLLQLLEKQEGLSKPSHYTAREFSRLVSKRVSQEKAEKVHSITELYEKLAYGDKELSEAERENVRAWLSKLEEKKA